MPIEHKTSISVNRNIEKIYDLATTYYTSQKFTVESGNKPNNLTLNFKGTHFTTTIRKVPQKLYINFHKNNDNTTKIDFHYVIQLAGIVTAGEYDKLNHDIMNFKNHIMSVLPEEPQSPAPAPPQPVAQPQPTAGATCPNCQKAVSADFAVCPYCTQPLKQTCSNCNKELNPEFAVCPYCATPK